MSIYRIAGAAVALVTSIFLLWLAAVSFGPEETVLPSATVTAQGGGAEDARGVLRNRSEMLRWRDERPDTAVVTGEERLDFKRGDTLTNADALVQSWRAGEPGAAAQGQRGFTEGTSSLPYAQAQVYEQPEGRDWRRAHNDRVRYGGGWLLLGVILALALFLAFRGRVPLAEGYSGERIERFNRIERANHWMTATSFLLMGLTGLVLIYGKPLLLPLIGHDAMGALGIWSAWLHMAFAVPFVIGVVAMIGLWVIDNLPDRYDWPWLKQFGGMLDDSAENPPADKFNTGQKLVFWAVVLGGIGLLASGLAMMFPFFFLGYDGMQWAQLVHSAVALAMIAVIFGHIYIGTVGMEDAFSAMWSGMVDRNWLKEHHSAWLAKISGRRRPEPRGADDAAHVPAE